MRRHPVHRLAQRASGGRRCEIQLRVRRDVVNRLGDGGSLLTRPVVTAVFDGAQAVGGLVRSALFAGWRGDFRAELGVALESGVYDAHLDARARMPQLIPLVGVDDGGNVPHRLVHAYDEDEEAVVSHAREGGGLHLVVARRQVLVSKPVRAEISDRQMGDVLGFADALQIQMRVSHRVNGHVDARGLFERERVAGRVCGPTEIIDEVGGEAVLPSPSVGFGDGAGDAPYRPKRDFAAAAPI